MIYNIKMFRIKIINYFIIYLLIGLSYTQDITLTILQNIQNNADLQFFTILTNLATNLPVIEDTVIGKGVKYTIFAPSDQAFGKLGKLDPAAVDNILRYHIIPIEAKSSDFNNIQYQPTLIDSPTLVKLGIPNAKQKIIIKNDNGVITVSNGIIIGKVVSADNLASNGVFHIIDSIILLPESPMSVMSKVDDVKYFGEVINGANLASSFEDFIGITIFAPSNEALTQAPHDLLSTSNLTQLTRFINYHVVPKVIFSEILVGPSYNQESEEGSTLQISMGENTLSVNDAKVIVPDILLNNGVLHIIDKYIVAPGIPNAEPIPPESTPPPSPSTTNQSTAGPTTSSLLGNNKNSIIISSVLGGIIGMAFIGIGLSIFYCKKYKKRKNDDVSKFKSADSVTTSYISYIPSERESHSPNFTQISSVHDHPFNSNHEPVSTVENNIRIYPNDSNHVPIDDRSRHSNEESNIAGSGSKKPSAQSETTSIYGAAPYDPNPSNTTSVYSISNLAHISNQPHPSNSNSNYPSPPYPPNPPNLVSHSNPTHPSSPSHTRPSTSYNINNHNTRNHNEAHDNSNNRNTITSTRTVSPSHYYYPRDFPYLH
ncbi:FAS1 domain-containing protein [Glomus cerebriforme]|uniref:FAS1 domain-containing protein n=1 Tax=Glomus cerebriforme TaxID=658196 RepID=A0A397TT54_9GLOM|nr:FAS1 domain-containing protein [Glomus cerebriforme]